MLAVFSMVQPAIPRFLMIRGDVHLQRGIIRP